jgi:hypothetical protein
VLTADVANEPLRLRQATVVSAARLNTFVLGQSLRLSDTDVRALSDKLEAFRSRKSQAS